MRFPMAVLAAGLMVCLAYADDDKFDSDNKATTVRPPVKAGGKMRDVPLRATEADYAGKAATSAADLVAIEKLIGKEAVVIGPVGSVYVPKGGKKMILNFGKDFRTCFKAVVDDSDFTHWGTKDANAVGKMYDGKKVAVTGLVTTYQDKPQILVTLPHQLVVVGDEK